MGGGDPEAGRQHGSGATSPRLSWGVPGRRTTILTILVSPPGYQGWDLTLKMDLLVLGPGSVKIKEATRLRVLHLRDGAGK